MKVKAVSIAVDREGHVYLVDNKGRLWAKDPCSHESVSWHEQDIPDEPNVKKLDPYYDH